MSLPKVCSDCAAAVCVSANLGDAPSRELPWCNTLSWLHPGAAIRNETMISPFKFAKRLHILNLLSVLGYIVVIVPVRVEEPADIGFVRDPPLVSDARFC